MYLFFNFATFLFFFHMWQWHPLFCASENLANDNRHQQQHHHHWLSEHQSSYSYSLHVSSEGFMNLILLHHVVVVIFENKNNGASKKKNEKEDDEQRRKKHQLRICLLLAHICADNMHWNIPQVLQFNERLIQWYAHWHGSLSRCRNSNMHHMYNSVDSY